MTSVSILPIVTFVQVQLELIICHFFILVYDVGVWYIANINHEFYEWYLYHVIYMHNEALFIDKRTRFRTKVIESTRQLRNCFSATPLGFERKI